MPTMPKFRTNFRQEFHRENDVLDIYIYDVIQDDYFDWFSWEMVKSETSSKYFLELLNKHRDVKNINIYIIIFFFIITSFISFSLCCTSSLVTIFTILVFTITLFNILIYKGNVYAVEKYIYYIYVISRKNTNNNSLIIIYSKQFKIFKFLFCARFKIFNKWIGK